MWFVQGTVCHSPQWYLKSWGLVLASCCTQITREENWTASCPPQSSGRIWKRTSGTYVLNSCPEFQRTIWIFQNHFAWYEDIPFSSPVESLWAYRVLGSSFPGSQASLQRACCYWENSRTYGASWSSVSASQCKWQPRDPHIILILTPKTWTFTLFNSLLLSSESS